ncbi:MAG: glycogen debranching enzyme N-terminal domain-containing protein [Verrucomicrobiota bacterium]|nr:glycogen debranching enzyme N-terminal domain-containing protein [Verrucomicrobiota bacterium]
MDRLRPIMSPAPGERLRRFVGDTLRFTLTNGGVAPSGKLGAFLRTNLGRAAARRREIITARAGGAAFAGLSWRDLPLRRHGDVWEIEIPLAEAGYFKAKAYFTGERRWQYWPEGPDVGISVHPDSARTANTLYCAFTRLFGETKNLPFTRNEKLEAQLRQWDERNFTVIPPSGKLRDLARQLPHVIQTLGCRVLHLLPIHPTPTTFARFGRFGSPYAALDLTAIDPALVEFDKRSTGVDQFCELAYTAHSLGARVFLDIVLNHTGWGSVLQENSPEFFLRNADGTFASPGAWGVTWEDLVELKHDGVLLWDKIADALRVWCRRGVDGFRCDAGYKIPVAAWQYLVARVQDEFPDTLFLLEGLGGSWEATEALLTEGGMQWAYSELFQNYSGAQVAGYLDYANRQSERVGTYVHYSETHDNPRLAAPRAAKLPPTDRTGIPPKALCRAWSLLRNRLCALTSVSGGFGFTCGVEWLADEKIRVHDCTGLNWGGADNLVPELARLNELLAGHPCFFDGAKLSRLSPADSPVYALLRESAEAKDFVLVLVNTDAEKERPVALDRERACSPGHRTGVAPASNPKCEISKFKFDLLGQAPPKSALAPGKITFTLAPGAAFCLAPTEKPAGLSGENYRRARARAAFAFEALNKIIAIETIDGLDWRWLAEQVERSPESFLAAAGAFAAGDKKTPLAAILSEVTRPGLFPRVVTWTLIDARRVTPVPSGHWLLVADTAPFRTALEPVNSPDEGRAEHAQSIPAGGRHVAAFAPRDGAADARLTLERYAAVSHHVSAAIRFLPPEPQPSAFHPAPSALVLLTNGRGGMARLCVDLGRVNSKYDCVLGANLNADCPVDRHVLVKRMRVWVNADGFLSPLDLKNLAAFEAGPPAVWSFVANAGDGRTVEIDLRAEMVEGQNTVVFQFSRPTAERARGKQLPAEAEVRLTVRFDIEDRNFHWETKRTGGAEFHFSTNTHTMPDAAASDSRLPQVGFAFTPDRGRQLRVFANSGEYHPQPEWCENIPHPVEQSRGLAGNGDAYSPGWFEIPLPKGADATLVATAEPDATAQIPRSGQRPKAAGHADDFFADRLTRAAKQFVVRRGAGKTVIAGYPWFLDWGRDTLVACRGLLAAGMIEEVREILLTFAKFEKKGTLPNAIFGANASNRETSDAPLWFALAVSECADKPPHSTLHDEAADSGGRPLREVLASIAENYARGAPNGIRMDPDSALIWSPAHFTWMDTNFPAGTPREGYPVEIQVLWIRLLQQLEGISASAGQGKWRDLAERAMGSFENLFWLEDRGWFADVLLAAPEMPAREAAPSDTLRSNGLFAVSLGLVTGDRAKCCVEAARKFLVVPGAVRSLAPLPVSVPLPIYRDGHLLNNPVEPYWPRYEGDEDTRRKPAYHNGTAWTWLLPNFCEALARAWRFAPESVAAAKSYLTGMESLLNEGCLGQIPEILDGDAPHVHRGCDAQAWSVTETLRVWKLLSREQVSP